MMASMTDGELKVWIKVQLDEEWKDVKHLKYVGSHLFPAVPVSGTIARMAAEAERRQLEENKRRMRGLYCVARELEIAFSMVRQAMVADFGKLLEEFVLVAEAPVMYPRMAFLLTVIIAVVAMITG